MIREGAAVRQCGGAAGRECASFLLMMKSSISVVSLHPMPPHALSMIVRVRVRVRARARVGARARAGVRIRAIRPRLGHALSMMSAKKTSLGASARPTSSP